VSSLVGKSLLTPRETPYGETRYAMFETVREFAAARLAAHGERDAARQRHAAYFLALAERSEPIRYLPDGERVRARLDAEHANLRAVLTRFHEQNDAERLLRLASALAPWSSMRGHLRECRDWLERAVALGRAAKPESLAKGLINLGITVHMAGDEQRALELFAEGHSLLHAASDPYVTFCGLTSAGLITLRLNDLDGAAAYQQAALALIPRLGQHLWVELAASTVLGHLGNIAVARGDIDQAEAHFNAALDRQRALGFAPGTSHPFASHPIAGLGDVARARGDHAAALATYQNALTHAHHFRDTRATVYALGGIAGALAAAGGWKQAAQLFGASEALHEMAGIHFDLETMDRQRALGLPEPWQRANDPFGAGQSLRDALDNRRTAVLRHVPDPETAARLWAEGRALPLDDAITIAIAAQRGRPSATAGLTTREQEVLRLLAAGKSNQQIGAALFISPRTAQAHVTSILAKLGAASRTEAAAVAHRLKLT
jgi:DNA-binding CsgD family transcriptional regulator/tetratricopeptide (TPR) repeat protein